MAGTSIGVACGSLIGCRVAGPGQYIPAHIKNGQEISACLRVTAFINRQDGRTDRYSLTLWGKLADAGAKSLSPGKEFHVPISTPQSYEGRVFDENQQPLLKADGTPRLVWKTNFIVNRIIFGSDSEKHIAQEIALGKRPSDWATTGRETWRAVLIQRQAQVYMGGETFGYAKVIIPQGAQVKYGQPAGTPAPGYVAPTAAPVYNTPAPGAFVPQVNPGMVNHAVTNMAGSMNTAAPGTFIDPNNPAGFMALGTNMAQIANAAVPAGQQLF